MHHPPQFLFVHVNRRCNLRCQHCVYWKLDDGDKMNYMPWERKREIIDEFAELNPKGAVVVCGGESMLDLEDFFAITNRCAGIGLRCFCVINGTGVRNEGMADRMIHEGPSEITVSLDSHLEEFHDRQRGVKGSFRMAVTALRLLLEARRRFPARGTRIYVMALVHEENYRDLDAFYDFVLNDIKADKMKLNFLQPTFGGSGKDDFFERFHITDPEALGAIIEACDLKYKLNINPRWLEHVKIYFRSINNNGDAHLGWQPGSGTEEPLCNSYERNVMVDLYGNARLCFSTAFPAFRLKQYGDLRHFWYTHSNFIRRRMRRCRRYCGISHSVRRENGTVKAAVSEQADRRRGKPIRKRGIWRFLFERIAN
jgi:MoaA/NifB/PqqE/SkfB family radical SAM enzyme